MDGFRYGKQIKLIVLDNEPLARLAEQRLQQEDIRCVVRALGAGPGGWGVATNLPHAIFVKSHDEMRARQVLDLAPAEIAERDSDQTQPAYRLPVAIVVLLIITAAALLFGTVEIVVSRIIR